MNILNTFCIILLSYSLSFTAFATATLPAYSKAYDDQRDPFIDAQHAISLANSSQRNILIEIGGNWCSWCQKLDAFLNENTDIKEKLHQNFVLLKVNVSDSNENSDFMKSLPPVLGYPHMYVSTSTGKMLLSKDTAEFLQSGEYSRHQWLSFLEKWQLVNNNENLQRLSAIKTNADSNNANTDTTNNTAH